MIIHNIPSSVDYNYWLKSLNFQLNEFTIQKSSKVLKVVKPKFKKMLSKTLGTSVVNSPLSPSFLFVKVRSSVTKFVVKFIINNAYL